MTSIFTNSWMLFGLVAVTLPWLIEWLFRRRKRLVQLPTLRYLLRNKEQTLVKRQDRILLILRTLAVFFLALTLARPIVQQRMLHPGQTRHILILLDATASMNQQIGVTTAFGLAQKRAANLVRGLPNEVDITVALLGDTIETLLSAERDALTVAGRIESLRAPCGNGRMCSAAVWIKDVVAKIGASPDARPELYIFSDFQQFTWKRPGMDGARDAQVVRDLASAGELFLIDVGGTPEYNYLITDLRPVESLITTSMPVKFTATLEMRGRAPNAAPAKVTFIVDGVKKDLREWVPSEKPSAIEFETTFQKPGEYLVEAVLEGDEYPFDNRRLYLCSVLDDAKVLVLDENVTKEGGVSSASDSLFLTRAIAPPNRPGADRISQFAVKTISPAQLAFENLDEYAAVILVATHALTPNIGARLERYVSNGGSAWFFLGPTLNAYDYNKVLYKEGKGLLPCLLGTDQVATPGQPSHIDFSGSNPALLALSQSGGNTSAQMTHYINLDVTGGADKGGAQVLLSLSNGAPAVVERAFGRGRALLFNTTAGPAWTRFPALPEYPILIQSLLTHSIGNLDSRVNLNGGDRFESPVFVSSQQLLLKCPDGRKERLAPQEQRSAGKGAGEGSAASWFVSFDRTQQPGVYEFADVQKEVLARRRFVVNPRTDESDVSRFSEREFRDFAGGADFTWSGPDKPIEEFAAKLHSSTELAPWILVALTALLAIESFFAARFGSRRQSSPKSEPRASASTKEPLK